MIFYVAQLTCRTTWSVLLSNIKSNILMAFFCLPLVWVFFFFWLFFVMLMVLVDVKGIGSLFSTSNSLEVLKRLEYNILFFILIMKNGHARCDSLLFKACMDYRCVLCFLHLAENSHHLF